MAIEIKSIPILRKKAAKAFIKRAEAALSQRGSVDFSKQVQSANAILEKSAKR